VLHPIFVTINGPTISAAVFTILLKDVRGQIINGRTHGSVCIYPSLEGGGGDGGGALRLVAAHDGSKGC